MTNTAAYSGAIEEPTENLYSSGRICILAERSNIHSPHPSSGLSQVGAAWCLSDLTRRPLGEELKKLLSPQTKIKYVVAQAGLLFQKVCIQNLIYREFQFHLLIHIQV